MFYLVCHFLLGGTADGYVCSIFSLLHTVKPVLSGHLKIDKTKVLMENGRSKVLQNAGNWLDAGLADLTPDLQVLLS